VVELCGDLHPVMTLREAVRRMQAPGREAARPV
jgi:hypothetical protein